LGSRGRARNGAAPGFFFARIGFSTIDMVIHWFRRDLRLTDNTALNAAVAESGEVVPVYLLSEWKGCHAWTGPARQAFLCGCLQSLAAELRRAGGRLIIRGGRADAAVGRLFGPPADGRAVAGNYPVPIADHAAERDETLRRFRAANESMC
jgi:deoxyribodipyrimidine photolyase